jgi:glycosyltransferase involved in cell wall biosynthesis
MKVLQLHVGNNVVPDSSKPSDYYLQRISFHDGSLRYFSKWDITNADSQMHSLIDKGADIIYGHLSDRKSVSALWKSGLRLRKLCKQEKPDIVHVFWGTTTALITVLFSTKPVIISFSGSDLLGTKQPSGKLTKGGVISTFLSQFSALLATKIITKSEHMKQSLWAISRKKTTTIPNGLDLKKFMPIEQNKCKEQLGWSVNKKYILFFDGGGAIVKDTPLAKSVFEKVNNQMPDTEFFIVKNIVHDDLPYYYNAADVLLITSFHEGSNNSLKEARACNLPIVSVNVGDAQERLQSVENSYVVKSREPQQIADKVIDILKSNKRSNGVDVSGDVAMDVIADKIIEVYKSVLKSKP